MEFELDWSFTLGDRYKMKKYYSYKDFFSGKAYYAILLGSECTINPQHFLKIVVAIFEKIKILIFFLCELPLTLRYHSY